MKIKNGEAILWDCLEYMKNIPDGSIDCIVTDPPYRVISWWKPDRSKWAPSGMLSKNDWKIFTHNDIIVSEYASEFYRVLKDRTHCYVMCNMMNLKEFIVEFERVWFYIHNLLVWEKNNVTPNKWYMKNCEYVLFMKKGKAKFINNCGSKQVHKFTNPSNKLHPTEKPVELMELYIGNSSNEWDTVLDPFAWSLTTAVAAENTNRKWICIEKEQAYFDIGIKRLSK